MPATARRLRRPFLGSQPLACGLGVALVWIALATAWVPESAAQQATIIPPGGAAEVPIGASNVLNPGSDGCTSHPGTLVTVVPSDALDVLTPLEGFTFTPGVAMTVRVRPDVAPGVIIGISWATSGGNCYSANGIVYVEVGQPVPPGSSPCPNTGAATAAAMSPLGTAQLVPCPGPGETPPEALEPGDCSLLIAWKRIRRFSNRNWDAEDVKAGVEALQRVQTRSETGRAAKQAMIKYVREFGGLHARREAALDRAIELGGHANPAVPRGGQSSEPYFREAERLSREAASYMRKNLDIEALIRNLVRGCFPNVPPAELDSPENLIFDEATKLRYRRLRDDLLGSARGLKVLGALCNGSGVVRHGNLHPSDPRAQAVLLNIGVDTADILGAPITKPPPAPGDYCGLTTSAAEGYAYLGAWLFKELASDPPDFRYRRLARPAKTVALQIRARGVSGAAVDGFNQLLVNQARQLALGRALLTSVERAQGALLDGETGWKAQQQQAARGFGERLASLMDEEVTLRQRLVTTLRRSRVVSRRFDPGKPTRGAFARRRAKQQLAMLARLGLPRLGLLDLNSVSRPRVPASAGFPGLLATPEHLGHIRAAASALRRFAAAGA